VLFGDPVPRAKGEIFGTVRENSQDVSYDGSRAWPALRSSMTSRLSGNVAAACHLL
jgi:hypothetical protein